MLGDGYVRHKSRKATEDPASGHLSLDSDGLPLIRPPFTVSREHPTHELYLKALRGNLLRVVPENFFVNIGKHSQTLEGRRRKLNAELPCITYTSYLDPPFDLSFFLLQKYRANAFKFSYEMLVEWLVPGKRLNVELFYAMDFHLPEMSPDLYTLVEVMVRLENRSEYDEIIHSLPVMQPELRLGIRSAYYARKILEIKGLSSDQKTVDIQQRIAYLVQRLPNRIDNDVFAEMQHMLVMCSDEFKAVRRCRHLSRIITVQYLFRKQLQTLVQRSPRRRHLLLKLYKMQLHEKNRERHVLSIIVGVNFLRDKEILEERHLLRALQSQMTNIRAIKGSYFANKRHGETLCTLYLEVEKADGQEFTFAEIKWLQRVLPSDLKDRIEHPMHPVFNPRNEEEIMRNILTLGNQIKYVRDLPQVYITFDEQSYRHLFFTVILVRLKKENAPSIAELFQNSETTMEYLHDRVKEIGVLRRQQPKEATVFRVSIPKEEFLRADNSIDIFKARQYVVAGLSKIVGEIRDYNGGMIATQNELLDSVAELLKMHGPVNYFMLENFFYSLNPVIMRSVMEPHALKTLFLLSVTAVEQYPGLLEDVTVFARQDQEFLYIVAILEDSSLRVRLQQAIASLQIAPTSLATTVVMWHEMVALGYIYRTDNKVSRETFCRAFERVLRTSLCFQYDQSALVEKIFNPNDWSNML